MSYIQTRAPGHLRTSLQAMTLASMSLGMVVGYLIGGEVFQHYGGAWLYQLSAATACCALVFYGLSGGFKGPRP